MAYKQNLSGLDLTGIPLLHLRLENLAAAPGAPYGPGHAYFDTALNAYRYYDGTVWRTPVARGDHTGTQLSNTISDFTTAVRGNRLDQLAAPGANVAMAGYTLTGLSTAPNASGQAAEYSWVIGQVQAAAAGIASKPPVNAVATSNLTLSGLTAIDGYTPAVGDRILVTAQTTATQNGVYVAASGAWTRSTTDGAAPGEIEPGAMWLVTSGTINTGTQWRVSTTGTITVGTTNITIVQFGAGQAYSAGYGITLTGSSFSANVVAGGGVLVGASGLSVDTAVVTRKYAAAIGDGTSTSITVTHNLNTLDIVTAVRIAANNTAVDVDWVAATVNTATFNFASPPAASAYRVVVLG